MAGMRVRSTHAVTAAAVSCVTISSLPESGKGWAFLPPDHRRLYNQLASQVTCLREYQPVKLDYLQRACTL